MGGKRMTDARSYANDLIGDTIGAVTVLAARTIVNEDISTCNKDDC